MPKLSNVNTHKIGSTRFMKRSILMCLDFDLSMITDLDSGGTWSKYCTSRNTVQAFKKQDLVHQETEMFFADCFLKSVR